MIFVDFNEIRSNTKELEGSLRSVSQINGLCDVIRECGFLDIPYRGCNIILEHLDRFMASHGWISSFPHALEHHLLQTIVQFFLLFLRLLLLFMEPVLSDLKIIGADVIIVERSWCMRGLLIIYMSCMAWLLN